MSPSPTHENTGPTLRMAVSPSAVNKTGLKSRFPWVVSPGYPPKRIMGPTGVAHQCILKIQDPSCPQLISGAGMHILALPPLASQKHQSSEHPVSCDRLLLAAGSPYD